MYFLKRFFIVLLIAALAVGGYFGYNYLTVKQITNESSWQTISGSGFSIKAPSPLKQGANKSTDVLGATSECFYTSRLVGFDVSYRPYTPQEKPYVSHYTAEDYSDLLDLLMSNVGGNDIIFTVSDDKRYLYGQGRRQIKDYVGKSDEVWYIMAVYPNSDGFYVVDAYCNMEEKSKLQDSLFKMLDSFEVK